MLATRGGIARGFRLPLELQYNYRLGPITQLLPYKDMGEEGARGDHQFRGPKKDMVFSNLSYQTLRLSFVFPFWGGEGEGNLGEDFSFFLPSRWVMCQECC